uniref:Neurotransmitter-gated ion-channel ligand-binding domain-containing protein n=1 Tax=Trieres chinensis TaxID=1514140 RepID=A0A7S1YUK3_TRICV|mmetsp:Transcript_10969/g.22973  ORF Transcript_10969/g.22973 Transcript_10969/m.22973 type:complete len:581 (+) Transcript_10969:181-1923(+)
MVLSKTGSVRKHLLHGRDFVEALRKGMEFQIAQPLPEPPEGLYVGFTIKDFNETLIIYETTLDTKTLKLDGRTMGISGKFEHRIHKTLDLMTNKSTLGNPALVAKECFKGVWFPRSQRMMVQGESWESNSRHEEIMFDLDQYDLFFRENIIVGNSASETPESGSHLSSDAKFDEAVFLRRIPQSVAFMSHHKIMEFLNVDTDHFKTLRDLTKFAEDPNFKNDLRISMRILSFTGIDQVSQSFGARLEVTFTWLPTVQDMIYYISGGGDPDWEPEWCPMRPILTNKIEHREEPIDEPVHLVKIEKNGSFYHVLRQRYKFNSTFLAALELQNFPFDIQEFHLNLKMPKYFDKTNISFDKVVWVRSVAEQFDSSEWRAYLEDISIQGFRFDRDDYMHFSIVLKTERAWQVYFYRVILVMSLISVCSLFIIVLDAVDEIGDRLGYLVTMFLAALAYSIVITDYLPSLSYLTILDIYVSLTYVFICALMVSQVLQRFFTNEENIRLIDFNMNCCFLGVWLLGHCIFGVLSTRRYWRDEAKKLLVDENLKCEFMLRPDLKRITEKKGYHRRGAKKDSKVWTSTMNV